MRRSTYSWPVRSFPSFSSQCWNCGCFKSTLQISSLTDQNLCSEDRLMFKSFIFWPNHNSDYPKCILIDGLCTIEKWQHILCKDIYSFPFMKLPAALEFFGGVSDEVDSSVTFIDNAWQCVQFLSDLMASSRCFMAFLSSILARELSTPVIASRLLSSPWLRRKYLSSCVNI